MNEDNLIKGYKVIHPCIAAVTSTLEHLRYMQAIGPVSPGEYLLPRLYFSADLSQSDVKITVQTFPKSLLSATIDVTGTPQWLSLNIELGEGSFAVEDIMGLLAETQADTPFTVWPFIRSSRGGIEYDTSFNEALPFDATQSVTTLLHQLTSSDPLADGAGYHTLVLPLPPRSSAFTLHDMRVVHSQAIEPV